jgi:triosephosphate isomerase
MRRTLIAGNWKLHHGPGPAADLARAVRTGVARHEGADRDVALFPPYVSLEAVRREIQGSTISLGAQNAHWQESGAYTGEVAPSMLIETGCRFAIVGHSERRLLFGEDDAVVARKTSACLRAGLVPVVCVGEKLAERDAGREGEVVRRQLGAVLDNLPTGETEIVVAYEPVWAIGTGRVASPEQVADMHGMVRGFLCDGLGRERGGDTLILYGGSVKPDNAAALLELEDVDGALVGGASLSADTFLPIVFWDSTLRTERGE